MFRYFRPVRAFTIESDVTGSMAAARGDAVTKIYVMSEIYVGPYRMASLEPTPYRMVSLELARETRVIW